MDGLYPSFNLAFGGIRRRVTLVMLRCTTTTFFSSFAVFLLLTWEFASLTEYAVCGEAR